MSGCEICTSANEYLTQTETVARVFGVVRKMKMMLTMYQIKIKTFQNYWINKQQFLAKLFFRQLRTTKNMNQHMHANTDPTPTELQ